MNLDNLESIEIGNDCFGAVQTFKIDGLNRLKTIKIGINSFTQIKQSEWDSLGYSDSIERCKQSKSFYILNCESLESIQIGQYSFIDFAGEFELKNLSQLQSIQIGTIDSHACKIIDDSYSSIYYNWQSYSSNFYHSSFVTRGINMILII